jgi:hypothetical protein
MFTLFWVRPDGLGMTPMYSFDSRDQAEAAIPAAKQELLDYVDDGQRYDLREQIEAGTWLVQEIASDGEF